MFAINVINHYFVYNHHSQLDHYLSECPKPIFETSAVHQSYNTSTNVK